MFVITLKYTAPLEAIDTALDAHAEWLDAQYTAGVFLASGRQQPRVGGVILAAAAPRDEIERLVALDPFHTLGLAEHEIVEFLPTRTALELAEFLT